MPIFLLKMESENLPNLVPKLIGMVIETFPATIFNFYKFFHNTLLLHDVKELEKKKKMVGLWSEWIFY